MKVAKVFLEIVKSDFYQKWKLVKFNFLMKGQSFFLDCPFCGTPPHFH